MENLFVSLSTANVILSCKSMKILWALSSIRYCHYIALSQNFHKNGKRQPCLTCLSAAVSRRTEFKLEWLRLLLLLHLLLLPLLLLLHLLFLLCLATQGLGKHVASAALSDALTASLLANRKGDVSRHLLLQMQVQGDWGGGIQKEMCWSYGPIPFCEGRVPYPYP